MPSHQPDPNTGQVDNHDMLTGTNALGMSSLNESGCAPGVNLIEMGPPQPGSVTVGSGGGYGAFYCFSLVP